MNYTVEWRPSALSDLAAIWNDASDRAAVTSAANHIDQRLAHDPLSQGESREGATRILFVSPLAIYFDVDAASRSVSVWAVWVWAG